MKPHPFISGTSQLRAYLLGAVILAGLEGRAQTTTPPAAAAPETEAKPVPVETSAKDSKSDDKVLELSPFQVTGSGSDGYRATATMSGTRLKTNLEDLAASISVVTKQQLEDTAAVDINDIFKYELSTEGTSQWTDFSVDRGNVTDNVAREPASANRVRGLTSANVAQNGFTVALPLDTYNVDAVEISRGPNSTVFGLGSTGGGVNIIRGRASTQRDSSTVGTRGDSYDGYRGSFDLNRVLVNEKLAFRLFGLYEDKGYVRKPSEDLTRRLNLVTTIRPFKDTSIYAGFESYRNENNRPNSLTPRDTVTDWVNSGKPTWDPITQTVHFANGTSQGPVIPGTATEALLPYGLAVSDSTFQNSPSLYVEPNGALGLLMISRLPNATSTGPSNVAGTGRLLQSGSYYIRNTNQFPLYNSKQITDQSLYDWTSVNLVAPNYSQRKGETSTLQIEQVILNTPRQSLAAEASWLKEKVFTYDRRFLGTGGASLQPFIDINERLLDGSVNPYFLRPYVGGASPRTSFARNNSESYRTTIAYELNLTRESSILRWLGRNRFTGYGEYRAFEGGSIGFVDGISSTSAWMGTVTTRNNTPFRTYPRYYVGDASGSNVDYAPAGSPTPPYSLPLRYYNGVTAQWINDPTTYDYYYNANRYNKRILSTYGGVWQGFLWHDRIVPLIGLRNDYNRSREANTAINPTAATNGYFDYSPVYEFGTNAWILNRGRTENYGVVLKEWPIKGLSLSYNQSNSFNPGNTVYDVWGLPLPDPRGESKDYGFSLRLFEGKLYITAKQFETIDIGRSTGDLNTIVQRTIRMDRRSSSGDPGLTDWYILRLQQLDPTLDQATAVQKTFAAVGADYDYIRNHLNREHGDASDSVSRGKEVEVTYNPTKYWTMKLTASESTPLNGIMSQAVQDYIAERMPVWTTVKDPVTGNLWWTNPGDNGTVPSTFYTANVLAGLKLAVALQGKRRSQTAQYQASFITNYNLAGVFSDGWLNKLNVGGSLRWRDKQSIGFLAAAADPDGIVREYDPNKPVWEGGETTLDLNARYTFRMFNDKIRCRLQLNVNNVLEDGKLKPVQVNPDGTPWAFRIIDPRQFILSASFDL